VADRLEAGAIIDGRYRVTGRLGSGGMADVYAAEDLQLGRRVALKLLYRRFAEDAEFVERFRREASSAAGLQHPNVVSIYDRGETDGTSYIAMELIDGRTLKQVVAQDGPLEPGRAAALIGQVLRAARFAHRRGVIHRDLKPHNVMVDAEDRAKVTDFGIARAGASDMTQTGSIMGTAQYLSPEQAQGLPVSAASDLYSIGIMLYELLTGMIPFDGESAVTIALKQVSEPPMPPSALRPGLPPALEGVVLRALEKEPARRFADADEFLTALEHASTAVPDHVGVAAAAPMPTSAMPPVGPPTSVYAPYAPAEPPPEPEHRDGGRWWIALLAGLIVAALVVGGLLLFSKKEVTVPSVVGADQAQAELTLRNKGFSSDALPRTSNRKVGTVIGQDPPPGTRVAKGKLVNLFVSAGPGEATIPDLSGQGRLAARRQLTGLGFRIAERRETSDTVGQNRVITTVPAPGAKLERGQTITLVISSGRALVTVPDVVGQTQDSARSTLENAGFTVKTTEQPSQSKDPGTVLSQNPKSGASVASGSTVTLVVAKQPQDAAVPNVTGKDQTAAGAALLDAGFKIDVQTQPVTDPAQVGIVLRQRPSAGRRVKRGSTVILHVGAAQPTNTTTTPPAATTTTPPAVTTP
jgi:beta-lactam-binding protein with PASTA domain/predicted Ser/Thr protein kinase